MEAPEAIERLEQIMTEYGGAKLKIPDPLEARWLNDVDRIEYDPERDAILLISDS